MTSIADTIRNISQVGMVSKNNIICKLCSGKSVLDVGCIGQAYSSESPDWLHGQLSKVASRVLGVDIASHAVKNLRDDGFNVIHVSELNSLQEQFDIVLMADVIEHVSNPGEFIRDYSRFVESGKFLISTPNSLSILHQLFNLFSGKVSVNAEHTCWFDPITLSQLTKRYGLEPSAIWWLTSRYRAKAEKNLSAKCLIASANAIERLRPSAATEFLIELLNNDAAEGRA